MLSWPKIRLTGIAAPVMGPLARAGVERKRVRSPEEWRRSSFRWIELGKQEQESLAVDDWREGFRDDPDGEALAVYTRSQWRPFLKSTRKDEA